MIWLHGVAGSGKSTVATSIENYFRGASQLGAYLKFERGKSDPDTVIREIALNLAMFDSSIGSRIFNSIETNGNITSAMLSHQFEKLLLEPLSSIPSESNSEPIVIVIDALDECGTPSSRKTILHLMKNEFGKLPTNFRFLLTSRPEHDIDSVLSNSPEYVRDLELEYTSAASCAEVRLYLQHEMRRVLESESEVGQEWESNIAALANAAGGLFIWASTTIKLVEESTYPLEEFEYLASVSRNRSDFGLDKLFRQLLLK